MLSKHKVIIRILNTQVIEDSLIGLGLRNYFNKLFKKGTDLVINSNDGSNYKKFCFNHMCSEKYISDIKSIC